MCRGQTYVGVGVDLREALPLNRTMISLLDMLPADPASDHDAPSPESVEMVENLAAEQPIERAQPARAVHGQVQLQDDHGAEDHPHIDGEHSQDSVRGVEPEQPLLPEIQPVSNSVVINARVITSRYNDQVLVVPDDMDSPGPGPRTFAGAAKRPRSRRYLDRHHGKILDFRVKD